MYFSVLSTLQVIGTPGIKLGTPFSFNSGRRCTTRKGRPSVHHKQALQWHLLHGKSFQQQLWTVMQRWHTLLFLPLLDMRPSNSSGLRLGWSCKKRLWPRFWASELWAIGSITTSGFAIGGLLQAPVALVTKKEHWYSGFNNRARSAHISSRRDKTFAQTKQKKTPQIQKWKKFYFRMLLLLFISSRLGRCSCTSTHL